MRKLGKMQKNVLETGHVKVIVNGNKTFILKLFLYLDALHVPLN